MRKNNLNKTGLSLSQATSISNLCNQRASEIINKLNVTNNASKSVTIDGKEVITQTAKPLPANLVDLLKEKAELHACQAFLVENTKAKEAMLLAAKRGSVDLSTLTPPARPTFVVAKTLSEVDEEFGYEKLTAAELNEFKEAEAFAAHIGKFIHEEGRLTLLRKQLPEIPAVEWMEVKAGEKSPITITVHHTSEQLSAMHEELAKCHREYEQKVNYFKAKAKNLATLENARIAKVNGDALSEAAKVNNELIADYRAAEKVYNEQVKVLEGEFEQTRQDEIKRIAALKIDIDPRFQKVIDFFLDRLPGSKD